MSTARRTYCYYGWDRRWWPGSIKKKKLKKNNTGPRASRLAKFAVILDYGVKYIFTVPPKNRFKTSLYPVYEYV